MEDALSQTINLATYLAELSEYDGAPFFLGLIIVFLIIGFVGDWLDGKGLL